MKKPKVGLFEIRAYYSWMGEDGIARTEVKPGIDVNINDARENSNIINGLKTSGVYPLIIDSKKSGFHCNKIDNYHEEKYNVTTYTEKLSEYLINH